MIRVAFQGELGAFSEEALRQIWGDDAEPVSHRAFLDVARAVSLRHVPYGVLPVHNAIVGPIESSLVALAAFPGLTIVDETTVMVVAQVTPPAESIARIAEPPGQVPVTRCWIVV